MVFAVVADDVKAVNNLIGAGADVHVYDEIPYSHDGMGTRNKAIVQALVTAGFKPAIQDLISAASAGNSDVASIVIRGGVAPNSRDRNGRPALTVVAIQSRYTPQVLNGGHYPETANELIQAGADVNARGPDGETALMCAAQSGQVQIVRALLQAGADITLKDKNGRTAFDYGYASLFSFQHSVLELLDPDRKL